MYVREPVAMLGLQRDLRVLSELVKWVLPPLSYNSLPQLTAILTPISFGSGQFF